MLLNSGVKNKIWEITKRNGQRWAREGGVCDGKGATRSKTWKIGHDGILKELIPPAHGETKTANGGGTKVRDEVYTHLVAHGPTRLVVERVVIGVSTVGIARGRITSVTSIAGSNVGSVKVVQTSLIVTVPTPVAGPVGSGANFRIGAESLVSCYYPLSKTHLEPPFEFPPTPVYAFPPFEFPGVHLFPSQKDLQESASRTTHDPSHVHVPRVSITSDSGSRVGLSAVPCVAAKRVQNITIVSEATALGVGVTVVVSTHSRTTGSSVGRSTIGDRGGIDNSDEKSKDHSVKHFGFVVGVGVRT